MFEGADTAEGLSTVTAGQALIRLPQGPAVHVRFTLALSSSPTTGTKRRAASAASLRPSAHSPRIPASWYAHNAAARHAVAHRFGMAPVD